MDVATVSLQQIYYVLKIMSIIQLYLILASELDSDSIEPTELTELLYMKQFQDVNHTSVAKWAVDSFIQVVCVQGHEQ